VPTDGDPQYLSDTAYPIGRLYERLGALKAKRVVVALDSCFSGAGGRSVLAKGVRPLVTTVEAAPTAGANLLSLAASSGDQISGTAEDQGHGLFTYYLLKGLNESGGKATVRGLLDAVRPKVQDHARRANREQTPQLTGAGDADAGLD
ncbi:caspase family protein, partial [bacterium]